MAINALAHVTSDEVAAPPLPRTVAETGLSIDQIEQLSIKTLYAGELSGVTLADRVCLPYSMLEPLIERLRAERLVEVRGATGSGTAGYRYALTRARICDAGEYAARARKRRSADTRSTVSPDAAGGLSDAIAPDNSWRSIDISVPRRCHWRVISR